MMYKIDRILLDENKHEADIACAGEQFLITQADLERIHIIESEEISDEQYEQLCEADSRLACIKKAFSFLSYNDMPAKKLADKLSANFDKNTVSDVVELLKERKYLNDAELASRYAKSFYECKLWGPIRIKNDLFSRGFSRDDIDEACHFLEETEHKENVLRILREKFGTDLEKIVLQKQKICAYLYRMGYAYGDISDAMNSIADMED